MTIKQFSALKFDSGTPGDVKDALTIEEILQITVNHFPYTTTMRTPGDDYLLAKGLLWTEGVIQDRNVPLVYSEHKDPISRINVTVNLSISERFICKEIRGNRSIASSSSCGMCGKVEASDIEIEGPPLKSISPLNMDLLERMQCEMCSGQITFNKSGGSHAAAAFTIEGRLLASAEDIGRHNAVDKVVGALLEEETLDEAQCLLISGRLSYEIISKAYAASIPYVVAISALSSLAVETAQRLGMTAIGFCRGKQATVYSNIANVCSKV